MKTSISFLPFALVSLLISYNAFGISNCAYPGSAISDLATTSSTIVISGTTGVIIDLNISVGITHTFIDDLTIWVVSPAGTTVYLYDRGCGIEDNIQTTFDDEGSGLICPPTGNVLTIPVNSLSAFDGQSLNGTWTLYAYDNANQDVGTLNEWCVNAALVSRQGEQCTSPQSAINDNSTTSSSITITGRPNAITDLNVYVNLTHTFIGDLAIWLVSPGGTTVYLYNHGCGVEDNIQTTFDDEGSGLACPPTGGVLTIPVNSLSAFDGQNFNGTWTLNVQDNATQDAGTLIDWCLIPTFASSCPNSQHPQTAISDIQTTSSQITFSGTNGLITDINVFVDITHTYIGDLNIWLVSPIGTNVSLFNRSCFSDEIILTYFDDEGSAITCPPAGGVFTIPDVPLTAFDGQSLNGTWTLFVQDNAAIDEGTFHEWCLQPTLGECSNNGQCDDGNPCTSDICVNSFCRHNCTLDISNPVFTANSVQGCNDGTVSASVGFSSCNNSWSAFLYNGPTTVRSWSSAQGASVSWTNIPAGNYLMVATDFAGCSDSTNIPIGAGVPCSIQVNNLAARPASVQDCNDGNISAIINAFTCQGTWSASLLNDVNAVVNSWSFTQGSAILWSNLPSGNYSVSVNDGGSCTTNPNISIPAGPPCRVEIQNVQKTVVNCGNNNMTADISVLTCNNAWYAYLYVSDYSSFIRSTDNSLSSSIIWINIPLGEYHLLVTDFANCSDTVDIILTCSDDDPCTIDECNGGCSHSFKCEDNNPCTEDFCQVGGVCVNQPIVCNDNNPCTTDACVNGNCVSNAINCADNNPCTTDQCINGNCTHTATICNDGNACTNDFCQGGNCMYTPICILDDNNLCTDDFCVNRTCLHVQKNCNDNNSCTQDFCTGGTCFNAPICTLDDGDACTTDQCLNGSCAHIPKDCNDNNSCTRDYCSNAVCFNEAICTVNDGNPCTADQCTNGQCLHTPINCSDNDPCTADACDNTGICTHNAFCPNDGDPCTVDQCNNGLCLYPLKNCSDGSSCTFDFCDNTGSCAHQPLCVLNDNNPCTADTCLSSQCIHEPLNCNDGNSCTIDTCGQYNTCVFPPRCLPDGNPCTLDSCANGQCFYLPINCSDNDLCTSDACDNTGACTNAPLCADDLDPCTSDICVSGQCLYTLTDCDDDDLCTTDSCNPSGNCAYTPVCVIDDGDLCTHDTCVNGTCSHVNVCGCTLDSQCDDGDLCTFDSCITITSTCNYFPVISCDDGNSCTDDYCTSGACANDTISCDDSNLCTVDSCDNGICRHGPVVCDDNDFCTTDTCAIGQCLFISVVCNDGDICTNDFCNPLGVCDAAPINCDDGEPCTADECIAGQCTYDPIICDDSIACTIDVCNNGNCAFNPVVCSDDNDPCTTDTCIGGSCLYLALDCDDGNPCTSDTCINGACVHQTLVCPDDGDLCTVDFCVSGQCVSELQNCNDNNICTGDACDSLSGNCAHAPVCTPDSDPCTNDTCIGGQCLNLQIVCNDNSACTNDNCVNGSCVFNPTCLFDDGDPCTNDTCISGGCLHIPKNCDDGVSCTNDRCDSLGNCINDATCSINDGDPCTNDFCANGDCVHVLKNCNDNSTCTSDFCQNGNCIFQPLCILDDLNSCTNDICISGQCFHQDILCNDGILCTNDSCQGGVCVYGPLDCDDGNQCTGDSCLNGNCISTIIPGCQDPCDTVVCTDGDLCTTDSCSNGSCSFSLINCDDNDPCTTDSCNSGACGHAQLNNCNLTISGAIVSELGTPIENVTVSLTGAGNLNLTTSNDGLFNFNVTQGDNCTITPSKSNDSITNNGVTTLDIILIQRQILAVQSLNSFYKKIAADVNNSQSATTLDIVLIRSVILQTNHTFPNGRLWTFVNSDFVFYDSLPPFPYDNFRSYPNISSNQTNQDFIGIKLGDVNGSWNPNIPKQGTVGEVQFMMNDYTAMPGDEIIIPVKVKDFNKITGFQFTLAWNPEVLQLLEVNNRSLNGFYGMNSIGEGLLTTSWFDEMTKEITLPDEEDVFNLKFNVTGAVGSYSGLTIGSELTESEAYNQDLDLLSIIPVNGMVKVGDASAPVNHQSSICTLRVQPNPFANSTNIIFTIPEDETVSIIIYDLLGKEVKHILGRFRAGQYSIEWAGDDDGGKSLNSGLYHIRMMTGDNALGLKVVLVR